MKEETMTLEQIEQHINNANLKEYAPGGLKAGLAGSPADVMKKVCDIYKVVKPILSAVLLFPLIPATIKNAITTFMNVMNQLCP